MRVRCLSKTRGLPLQRLHVRTHQTSKQNHGHGSSLTNQHGHVVESQEERKLERHKGEKREDHAIPHEIGREFASLFENQVVRQQSRDGIDDGLNDQNLWE